MASTALLVMDVQQGIVDRFGGDEGYLPRLATAVQAADLDYRLTVLADGCLDADPEVHRVLTDKVYPRQADVLRIAEWTESLAKPAAG
jgi:nicotinamidase-related amidase